MVEYHKTNVENHDKIIVNALRVWCKGATALLEQSNCDAKMILNNKIRFGFLHPMTPTSDDVLTDRAKYRYSSFRLVDPEKITYDEIYLDDRYQFMISAPYFFYESLYSKVTRVVNFFRNIFVLN